MSITLKKTFAGVALLAFLAFGAPTAKAQSVSELQAMIAALQAQIAALAGGSSSSSCTYVHTVTLKQGSTGSQVAAMQAVIGATADGKFGPMTKAKVQAFQASKGLVADGVVGPNTGAAIAASCAGNNGGGSSDDNSSSDLDGSFGTISTINTLSQYSNEEVGEGESDVKVAGFEVEASNDGDIMLNSIKLRFDPTGNFGSMKLNRYIDGVTVWMGSKEIGSADVSDFTKNSDDTYTRTIALKSSTIVRSDSTEKFYVTVDAVNTLDSGDISGSNDSWTVAIDNVRYEDGSGVVTTETIEIPSDLDWDSAGDGIAMNFVDFGTAADTELKLSTDGDSPEAGVVIIDDNDTTDDVVLLKGKIKLEGTSDALIDEFPVTFTTSGATNIYDITSSVTLKIDGEEYTESVTPSNGSGAAATLTFDNMDFDLSAGDTVEFEVRADINDIETGYLEEGDNLKADVTSTNRSAMDVENEEGDQLDDSSEKSGTTVGKYQEFRTQGIMVELVSTNEVVGGTDSTIGTFTIKFKVTAVGDDAYLGTTVSQGLTYTVDASGTTTTGGVSAVLVNNTDTDVTSQGNYLVEEGESETLTLTVSKADGPAGLFRASLTAVKWDSSDADTTMSNTYSSNMQDFHTDYVTLQ